MKKCVCCGHESKDEATSCARCGKREFRTSVAGPDPYLISVFPWYRRAHRKRLLAEPYPEHWEAILQRNVAHYRLLSDEQRSRLRTDLQVLVTEKNWDGCDGLKITEQMKVTIAAQAALMLLGMEHDYFSHVLSIVVFPTQFEMLREEWHDEKRKYLATGQAAYGAVFVAWDSALAEGRDPSSGHNLVIHEFAHQLDFTDGLVNGIPVLKSPEQVVRWSEVMERGFNHLREELSAERGTFLGQHAGSNATEFFSAVSERFFTVPGQLRDYDPRVYEVLAEYYGVDPLTWFAAPAAKG